MATQLAQYVADHGNKFRLNGRNFEFAGTSGDKELAVATFKTMRASYHAVLCVNSKVAGAPGAEVWAIIGNAREVARFAIHEGKLKDVS